jgi:hypothetical protein
MAKIKRVRDDETGKFVKSETAGETTDDTRSTDEVITSEKQRIADEQASEFLGEEVKNNNVVQKEEEPKEEPKVEEPKAEKVEEEEIDLGKIKAEITENVRKETQKEITQKLTEALGAKPTEAQKDKYEAFAEKFATEKGRNPSWFELVPFLKDEVKAELKREQEEATQQTEAQKKQVAEQNAQRQKAFNTYLDEQLNELQVAGKLNMKDEAVKKQFFQTMMEVNDKRVKEGKAPIYSAKEIFYEHYSPPTAQPAGADAPISVGRGSTQTSNNEEYSYADIHKPSWTDMFKKK